MDKCTEAEEFTLNKPEKPRVSIITATFNSARFLPQAIESVAEQDYGNIEYIVVDGGSKDGTVSIIRNYNSVISKYVSEPDKGIYDALNKGINMASGDIVAFLHSDDFYADTCIVSQLVKSISAHSADGAYGDLLYISQNHAEKVIRKWHSRQFDPKSLKFGWMPPHPTLFLKKKVYLENQLNDREFFDLSYNIAADYDFMLRIMKKQSTRLAYLPFALVKMRCGGVSNRSLKNIIQKMREDYSAIKTNHVGGLFTLTMKNLSKLSQFRLMQHYDDPAMKKAQ
ncbi:MAG: glycosyltransferase [Lentisphaerae bacterium]|nr:glycosyltransferase [Lentisphaerota bacterium]MCP4100564.1 glycosyltransferase [Lentisphaerota bacterium]